MKRLRKYPTSARLLCLSASLALGSLYVPAYGQAYGISSCYDPLAAGDLHRASLMLRTGNPLGTLDQLAASAPDFEGFPPEMKAQWLANEGGALFERNDAECLSYLSRLATEYPTSPYATQAILTMGDWHWLLEDWHAALAEYDKVDIEHLANEQRNLYSYRRALAYLKCGLAEKALPLFESLKPESSFRRAAEYYCAYIAYLNGDYDTAYDMMSAIADADSDGESGKAARPAARSGRASSGHPALRGAEYDYVSDGIEPLYYMAQIEYLRGQYPEVIDHAATIIAKRPVPELLPEMHRISGLSLFKTGDFSSARGHLEEFVNSTESPNDDAVYALAATEYADGDYAQAKTRFRSLTDLDNMLAQGAYLYLGQIAERDGDLNEAAMAFNKAAGMAFDPDVAETALFNYIVASSKGGNVPFASSIGMHEDFLKRYPTSSYASAVEESLASAFFRENNYAEALDAINRVKSPSETTLATKQKILYRLGCGEIAAGQFKSAAAHLREGADMRGGDSALAAECRLWLGDALYRSGDFKDASDAYASALKGNLTAANKVMARYGLAYSRFQLRDWNEAQKYFAEVETDRQTPADIKADALIREADCLLYMKRYALAADRYGRAAADRSGDREYAAFRHAVVAGVTTGTDRKMKELDTFLSDYPNSKWTPEALLEAGKTLASLDRPDKAAPYFERLSREYPQDSKSRAGALALALSYAKQGLNDKAESTYKDIIRTWPTSEEASVANDDMRRIAAANGTLMEYAQFLSGINGAPQIDPDEMDAITFEAAETAYADNPESTQRLEQYISQYPDGRYLANALMDLAEAADNAGDSAKALSYLEQLLTRRADSPQVPGALYLKADLLEDSGDKPGALETYLALEQRGGKEFEPEATAGVMRTTADAAQRTEYARQLMRMGGVNGADAEDARYYEASGMLRSGDREAGIKALEALAEHPDNLSGAKAAVELGEWYLENGDTKNALSTLEKFTDAGSIHAYWLARGFIALADAYHASGDDYLAAEYLKSLRDNYPGEEADITEAINAKISEYSK